MGWENWNWALISFNFFAYLFTCIVFALNSIPQENTSSPWGKFLLTLIIFIAYISVVILTYYLGRDYEYYVSSLVYVGISSLGAIVSINYLYKSIKNIDWKTFFKFFISPLFIGIVLFLLVIILSILYIPIVNQLWLSFIVLLSIGLGWLSAILFILSYIGFTFFLIMLFGTKSDKRTSTGYADNVTGEGKGIFFLYSIIMIVVGSILQSFSVMPSWCETIMCWPK